MLGGNLGSLLYGDVSVMNGSTRFPKFTMLLPNVYIKVGCTMNQTDDVTCVSRSEDSDHPRKSGWRFNQPDR